MVHGRWLLAAALALVFATLAGATRVRWSLDTGEVQQEEEAPAPAPEAGPGPAAAAPREASSFVQLVEATGVSGGWDLWRYVVSKPDQAATLLFALVSLIMFVRLLLLNDASIVNKIAELNSRMEDLMSCYDAAVTEMQGLLTSVSESSACFAQRTFEAKARRFHKFMERVRRDSSGFFGELPSERVLGPFRTIVHTWLVVFEQCSLDPVEKPVNLVSERELDWCTDVDQIADLLMKRLESHKVEFIEALERCTTELQEQLRDEAKEDQGRCSWVQCACGLGCGITAWDPEGDDDFPMECRLACLRLTLLSPTHARTLLLLLVGVAFAVLEGWLRKPWFVAVACCGQVCLLVILVYIGEVDKVALLGFQLKQFQREEEALELRKETMNEFHSSMEALTNLWRYRTVPRLDLLKELLDQLWGMEVEDRLAFLEGLNQRLQAIELGMGPLELWCGEESLAEDKLRIVATQLNDCTEFISGVSEDQQAVPKILQYLDCVLSVVAVRIWGAHQLTGKDMNLAGKKSSDPFVTIRVESTRQPLSTTTVLKNLNPKWNGEEFVIATKPLDKTITLHVWDRDQGERHDSLGYVQIGFRDLPPGQWHSRKERLTSLKKGHLKTSELEFEVLLTTDVPQLQQLELSSSSSESGSEVPA